MVGLSGGDYMLDSKETQYALQEMGKMFPNATTSLIADSDYHFLLAVILSAQTTDKAVNKITPALFDRYKYPIDMAKADPKEVAKYIKTIGLYKNKAKYLVECSKMLVENFNSVVPKTHKKLMSLSGVGRKTADVVLAERFGVPAFAVDTHVYRISKRLAIVPEDATVRETERILMSKVPKEDWIKSHHRMIFWGRYQCMARAPKCETCPLLEICQEGQKRIK